MLCRIHVRANWIVCGKKSRATKDDTKNSISENIRNGNDYDEWGFENLTPRRPFHKYFHGDLVFQCEHDLMG